MIDLELSDEQRALRELARTLFADLYPPERLRAIWDGAARDGGAWRKLAGAGLLGLGVDEDGVGATDPGDLLVMLEEAGRAALPEPLVETAAVAAPVIAEAGDELQRSRWLPAIAAGDALATVLAAGQPYALAADVADVLLAVDGDDVRVLARGTFAAAAVPSEDRARRLFAVELEDGAGDRLEGAAARLHDHGAAGTSAVLCGLAAKLLERSVAHARVREQFGQPIGAFQAVKHQLAAAHVALESARGATRLAACALAAGAGPTPAASAAKVAAAHAASLAGAVALQVHGGIGFTWDHDLHLWLKRALALEQVFGSPREHRERLAAALLDG